MNNSNRNNLHSTNDDNAALAQAAFPIAQHLRKSRPRTHRTLNGSWYEGQHNRVSQVQMTFQKFYSVFGEEEKKRLTHTILFRSSAIYINSCSAVLVGLAFQCLTTDEGVTTLCLSHHHLAYLTLFFTKHI